MKVFRTIIFLSLFSCSGQPSERQQFLNELGNEKSESFEFLTDSYELFLKINYPNISRVGEQSREFMIQIIEDHEPFIFDSLNAIQVLTELERTGLRKDIYLYYGEIYKPTYDVEQFLPIVEPSNVDFSEVDDDFVDLLPLDSIEISKEQKQINLERERELIEERKWYTFPNENGLYNYALSKTFKSDTSFVTYCEVRYHGLSPDLTTALSEISEHELELWQNQLPLMVDFYFHTILGKYGKYVMEAPTN